MPGLNAILRSALAFSCAVVVHGQEGRFVDVRPVPGLAATPNSGDAGPTVTADGLVIVFTSSRPGLGQRDLFMAERNSPDDPFGDPFNVGRPVNSSGYEHNAHISPDGLTLYFASDGMLYRASRSARGETFATKEHLGNCVNLAGNIQTGPSATADELELFFFTRRFGGEGGWDTWTARRPTLDAEFCEAEPVSVVNSAQNDMHCAIAASGLALVFDSPDRSPREGGNDIWIATRASRENAFRLAVTIDAFSLGSDVNGPMVDFTPSLSPTWPENGSKLYFSRGGLDYVFLQLYEATWITDAPEAEFLNTPDAPEVSQETTFDGTGSYSRGGHSIISYEWDFGDGNTAAGAVLRHAYATPGRYLVELTVTDENGRSDVSAMSINVVCGNPDLGRWSRADIGAPVFPGSSLDSGEDGLTCLSICAGGRDISRSVDECHFVYQDVSGDVALTVNVASIEGRSGSKGGIVLRENIEPFARSVALLVENRDVDRLLLQTRSATAFTQTRLGDIATPHTWLRLTRRSQEITAWSSTHGVDWVKVGRTRIDLGDHVLAGAAATGRDYGFTPFVPSDAQFCKFTVQPIETATPFRRGDCNDDSTVDISDAVFSLGSLFLGEGDLGCEDACDSNDDGAVDISDAIATLGVLFLGNGVIPLPGMTECDVDPTEDEVDCVSFERCR